MSAQQPSEAPDHRVNGGPSSPAPTHQALFATSEFRKRVVEILSRTANGCLQELNYRPSMSRDLVDIQAVAAKFQNENQKLFDDNRQLALMIKDARAKQKSTEQFYKHQVQALEQQIANLQRENQAILAREINLAAGHPAYAHLQEECLRLKNDCAQLKQHILELQAYISFPLAPNPNLSQVSLNRPNQAVTGDRPVQARIPQSIQDPLRQLPQLPAQGQNASRPQNAPQSQRPGFHPNRPTVIIPNPPRTFTQAQRGYRKNGGSPIPNISPVNQDMTHYRTPVSAIPRSASNSSKGSTSTAEINAQGLRMSASSPVTHEWINGALSTSPHPVATTVPHQLVHLLPNPPRRQVSAPLPGPRPQSQPHPPLNSQHVQALPHPNPPVNHPQPGHPTSTLSSAVVSPAVPGMIPNGRIFNPVMINTSAGVPLINPPQGVPTFAIGPPGNFLPSLAAYTKVPSPSTSISASGLRSGPTSNPTSRPGSPTNKTRLPTAPSQSLDLVTPLTLVDPTKAPPVSQAQSQASLIPSTSNPSNFGSMIKLNSVERSRTPHLTPSSSRGSAGPSEGQSEVMTPLAVLTGIVNVVESPTAGGQMMVEESHPELTIAPSLLMKRPSVHMDTDDEEVPLVDPVRKRPRLDGADEHTSSSWEISATVSTPYPLSAPALAPVLVPPEARAGAPDATDRQREPADSDAMDEDDEDDDDDEIGPDGTRSIRSCLDIFTEEDENGVSTCSLCVSRHHQGLIAEPTSFAPDATQEEKVQHFFDEHPTSWDNLLHGTIAPVSG